MGKAEEYAREMASATPMFTGDEKISSAGAGTLRSGQYRIEELVTPAVGIARAFHDAYEALAPEHGYETRKDSAVP